jgi:hypothetical protein
MPSLVFNRNHIEAEREIRRIVLRPVHRRILCTQDSGGLPRTSSGRLFLCVWRPRVVYWSALKEKTGFKEWRMP